MADKYITELNKLNAEFKAALERRDEAAEARINTRFSDLEAKQRQIEAEANRPTIDGVNHTGEFKAFRNYLATRDTAEYKAMSAGSATDGGVTIPKFIAGDIMAMLTDISPMRKLAKVVSSSTGDYNYPVQTSGAASRWVTETAARTETDSPRIENVKPKICELIAKAYTTQTLLEDSQFDLQSWLTTTIADEFDKATGTAFITGDGVDQPKGLLSYPTSNVTDKTGTRPFGTFQHIASGTSGAYGDADRLIDLTMSLKAAHRVNGAFLMSRATIAYYRKLKGSDGRYLWEPSVQAGMPSTLIGYPVYEDDSMPDAGANALVAAFGDFNRGYVIVDRVGMSVLVDPYSAEPYIAIKARTRVGGAALNTQAIKFLKLSAN